MPEEFQKTQVIRLLDVPLGMLMMYTGIKGNTDKLARTAMIVFGFMTITYNLNNYLKNEGKPGLW
jgi:hypothetical protein